MLSSSRSKKIRLSQRDFDLVVDLLPNSRFSIQALPDPYNPYGFILQCQFETIDQYNNILLQDLVDKINQKNANYVKEKGVKRNH